MYPLPRKIASWHSALALVALVLTPSMALAGKVDEQTYVSVKKINDNRKVGHDWPAHGFDYQETRFSPLDQINDKNVSKLRLA